MLRKNRNEFSFKKKILISGLAFLFMVLVIASFFGKRGLVEIYQAKKKKESLKLAVTQLTQKREKLMREIWELENDPKAVEMKAREKLWLMDPDEFVIVKN